MYSLFQSFAERKARTEQRHLSACANSSTSCPALALPKIAAETYPAIRGGLEQKGEMIGDNGLWIAAHALAWGLALMTNNEKEFRRVRGLKVQNWAT